jgi:hypothetical protein
MAAMRKAGAAFGIDSPAELGQLVSGGLSFDLGYPKIPGRDLEGVPNANDPVMREKLRQRLLKNPSGGEDLPGFIKKAEAPGLGSVAMDLIYGGPEEGDYSNMPVIPDETGEQRDRDALLEQYRMRAFPGGSVESQLIYS